MICFLEGNPCLEPALSIWNSFLCDGNHLPIAFLPFYVSRLRCMSAELGMNSKSEFSWILCCRELILHTRLLKKKTSSWEHYLKNLCSGRQCCGGRRKIRERSGKDEMYLYMRSVICLRGSPFKYCCSTFVRLLLSTGERSWRIGVLWWQKYSNMSYAHKHKGPPVLTPPPPFSQFLADVFVY